MFPIPWAASSPTGMLERIYQIPGLKQILDALEARGLLALPRDTRAMQARLLETGVICRPEDPAVPPSTRDQDDLAGVLREIKALMARGR